MRKFFSEIFSATDKENLKHFFLLLLFAVTMLFVRVVPVYHEVFTNWAQGNYGNFVNFAADDAVYHMRLVHNTLQHFPWRVFFDPFTHFPFGNQIHFGPLYTFIIDISALIVGVGHPGHELINHVGAYVPAVMGMLCLFPVYFTVRKLFGKTTAIFSAFVFTFLPGEFLQRSALGFADHHVAEVFFSSLTCLFLIYALDAAKTLKFTFKNIFWKTNRVTLVYGFLTGICFGLFVLTWPAALMFGAIFFIFFVVQLIIEHFKGNSSNYLLLLALLVNIIPALMILPYALMNPHLELTYYSLTQPLVLLTFAGAFVICYLLQFLCGKRHRKLYPLAIVCAFAAIILALFFCFPALYVVTRDGCALLFHPKPGMRTVAEVWPSMIDRHTGALTSKFFWSNFFWAMPFSIVGFGMLSYKSYEKASPLDIFLLIWTVAAFISACAQCRFNYYLAVNVAILAGYGAVSILGLIQNCKCKKKYCISLKKMGIYVFYLFFVVVIIDPVVMLLIDHAVPSGGHVTREWYDTLMWLKVHTPDPTRGAIDKNFDYAKGYYFIPKDHPVTYEYPKNAYGVMSWWDVGHQITYIGERIPNANPFQLGINEYNDTAGAAIFFTSSDEKGAVENLNKVGARYVLIGENMATKEFQGIGIWCNDTKNWVSEKNINIKKGKVVKVKVIEDSSKFISSMISRFFYDDANGMQHFRLIYESDGDYLVSVRRAIFGPKFRVDTTTLHFKQYGVAYKNVVKINHLFWANKNVLAYSARMPTKSAKIFEKVKGAKIYGKTSANVAAAKLSLKLKTKYGRIFTYAQTTKIRDGKYEFVVPYPTEQMRGDEYNYDVKPIGEYNIQIGGQSIHVFVAEKAVMLGKKIEV